MMVKRLLAWLKYKPYDEAKLIWLSLYPATAEKAIAFGERRGMVRAICVDGTCFGHYHKETIYPRYI